MKHQELALLLVFLLITNGEPTALPSLNHSCILDFQLPSSVNSSNCESGNWNWLIGSCCGDVFHEYLYALARRANKTSQILLNGTEQEACLETIMEKGIDVSSCGVDKLTGGVSTCSSYTTSDVESTLGKELRGLEGDCKFTDSGYRNDQVCSACSRRWEEIGGFSSNASESIANDNICRFTVLVTLMSNNIDDRRRIQAVYNCLSAQKVSVGGVTHRDMKRTIGITVLIIGAAGVLAMIIVAIWILSRKDRRNLPTGQLVPLDHDQRSNPRSLKMSIKEIFSATNNLDPSNFIGQGVAGKVYKGVLSNGQHVAVKHIINDGYVETFVREVTSLSHVRHPNLVTLLGFCKDDDGCFLVYELCHNGNLSEWLYSKDRFLSWIQRFVIAIGSAKGLRFLHTYSEGCIVHRDIKPTNILIDSNFQAKLSDFGLSKVIEVGKSYVSSEVRGTFGYVDPEYRTSHHVSSKGDVYSFGMVLLQLLSGQKVINLDLNGGMQLNKTAHAIAQKGNVTEFADPKLGGDYSEEAFEIAMKLALACTGKKQERPSMEEVILQLEKALNVSQTRSN